MPLNRKLLVVAGSLLAVLVLIAGIKIIQLWAGDASPLGEAMPINFPSISSPETQQFLEGDFEIIRRVEALPRPVLGAFTEQGGSRTLMANPGKKFEAADVILDASVPQKRLLFAGVSDSKCFVHYEQGGRGHSFVLAFFTLTPAHEMKPLWQGYCDEPAANIQTLRSKFENGSCSNSPYRKH
jgi:hypothetical protein